jgi:uncharacterized protein (DUF1810 family)
MVYNDGLERFLQAQQRDYAIALSEIMAGRKRSHWMWYIFPQIAGLGFSEKSQRFGLRGIKEAEDFLRHPVLGQRLIRISNELLQLGSGNARAIFGSPDDMKLRSSMTLFALLPETDPVFEAVLEKFFGGAKDEMTIRIIASGR